MDGVCLAMVRAPGGVLIGLSGKHGLLLGRRSPIASADEDPAADALPAVREYIARPVLPEGPDFPGLTRADAALALVAGARRAVDDVQAIELAAAQAAREHGATVRQLAAAAGISERAASDPALRSRLSREWACDEDRYRILSVT